MVKTQSIYLTWAWIGTRSWQTDRQTDRIPIANTRSAVPAGTAAAHNKTRYTFCGTRYLSHWRTTPATFYTR